MEEIGAAAQFVKPAALINHLSFAFIIIIIIINVIIIFVIILASSSSFHVIGWFPLGLASNDFTQTSETEGNRSLGSTSQILKRQTTACREHRRIGWYSVIVHIRTSLSLAVWLHFRFHTAQSNFEIRVLTDFRQYQAVTHPWTVRIQETEDSKSLVHREWFRSCVYFSIIGLLAVPPIKRELSLIIGAALCSVLKTESNQSWEFEPNN